MLDAKQIAEFQRAVSMADWNLDLIKFTIAIGGDPRHDYTRRKFRRFTDLNKALNEFDANTLSKILSSQ